MIKCVILSNPRSRGYGGRTVQTKALEPGSLSPSQVAGDPAGREGRPVLPIWSTVSMATVLSYIGSRKSRCSPRSEESRRGLMIIPQPVERGASRP